MKNKLKLIFTVFVIIFTLLLTVTGNAKKMNESSGSCRGSGNCGYSGSVTIDGNFID